MEIHYLPFLLSFVEIVNNCTHTVIESQQCLANLCPCALCCVSSVTNPSSTADAGVPLLVW